MDNLPVILRHLFPELSPGIDYKIVKDEEGVRCAHWAPSNPAYPSESVLLAAASAATAARANQVANAAKYRTLTNKVRQAFASGNRTNIEIAATWPARVTVMSALEAQLPPGAVHRIVQNLDTTGNTRLATVKTAILAFSEWN